MGFYVTEQHKVGDKVMGKLKAELDYKTITQALNICTTASAEMHSGHINRVINWSKFRAILDGNTFRD